MNNPLNYLADFLVLAHLVGILLYIFLNYKSRILDYFFSLLLAVGMSEGLKFLLDKPRPVLDLEGGSFPSTHAALAFNALFFVLLACHTLSKHQNREGRWFQILNYFGNMTKSKFLILISTTAISVGILRIVTGAHYIEDVLAGILVGLLAAGVFRYYDVSARRLK